MNFAGLPVVLPCQSSARPQAEFSDPTFRGLIQLPRLLWDPVRLMASSVRINDVACSLGARQCVPA